MSDRWSSFSHLPERFGLFTLILLGESVVGVMRGMESQEDWPPSAAASAFLGMAIAFLIWWWYFDGALGASEQPVRSRREAGKRSRHRHDRDVGSPLPFC